ncbi:MAG TPA: protein-L-isoaspartate(D-aspartate) O-methyltransferase [Chitinolyticbacter sp.]|uniref:protein-L-isoaspartate(D-aspartate) O-methyltransferase n=1 Tax=Chitinolyticbacter albus TaxID=2961951 RepID=UPI00210F176B|nr:protein-L-isoaspartate(D-aspartate) O-methyltransferase [Chitinolyticbacter albus]HSC80351.1 protein-L-isoaspartate(D-aspartate) O-methyltransferase [Chitinolyticbacter sp.]
MSFNIPGGSGMTSARTRARLVERLRGSGIADEAVLAVIGEVPRHVFVDEALSHRAYDDVSLPIGYNQTISQPYIVARMTELVLGWAGRGRILEIGTGCGYQTTVLAQFYKTVYSIERIGGLAKGTRERLAELGVRNVRLRHGDGSRGQPDAAPFDAIMITAAAPIVPELLVDQLAVGGRLVFPVGVEDQELRMIERLADGYAETRLEKVRFVPLLPGVA